MPVMKNSSYNQYGRTFESWTYINPNINGLNQSSDVSVISRTFQTDAQSTPFSGTTVAKPYYFDKREYFPAIGNIRRWEHGYWTDYSKTPPKSNGGADVYSLRPRNPSMNAGQLNYNSWPIQQATFNWLSHTDDWAKVHDRALSKIWAKVRSGPNLIVDLAESGATIRMLKGTISLRKLMAEFFNNLVIPRKLRVVAPPRPLKLALRNEERWQMTLERFHSDQVERTRRRLDYITSKWLEFRYGWSPAVYSIYDSLEALDHRIFDQVYKFTGRSGSRYKTEWRDKTLEGSYLPSSILSNATGGSRVCRWEYHRSTRCHMDMSYELLSGHRLENWTSLNPYSVGWELFPLSFVGDWVAQVGDYLESMENASLFADSFRGGYYTITFKGSVRQVYDLRSATRGGYSPGMAHSTWEGWGMDRKFKSRVLLTTQPRPLGIKVEVKLNAKRMLDAASLLQQLIGKRFR